MPGAPNRPPEKDPEPAPVAPTVPEPPDRKVLRRLAPARVALHLDLWKGAPSDDLLVPYEKAEAAYDAGDHANALVALDRLSVRFTEPRWPSLPEPFKRLRVSIPAPMPPHWDPEHALAPPEKEARRAKRVADDQLALLKGSVEWARVHGLDVNDLAPRVDEAAAILSSEGVNAAFYERVDAVWQAIRTRVPKPVAPAKTRAPTPPSPAEGVSEA
jgi:hypothetical protein